MRRVSFLIKIKLKAYLSMNGGSGGKPLSCVAARRMQGTKH